MRVFIAVSCFLAVASAGYYGGAPAAPHAPGPAGQYQGPLHIPVLDHNGVPVEPKEVQEARKSHLAALAAIPPSPAGQEGGYDGAQYDQQPQQQYQPQPQQQYQPQPQYNAPQQQYQPQPQYNAPQQQYQPQQYNQHQYQQPQQQQRQQPLPVIDANGIPQDAPDVAAAKAAHFAAYAEANARTAPAPAPAAAHYGPQQPHW